MLRPRSSVRCVTPQKTERFGGTARILCSPAPWSPVWVTRVLPQESPCTVWRVEGGVGKDPAESGRLAAERFCWGWGWAPVPALPWVHACEVRGPLGRRGPFRSGTRTGVCTVMSRTSPCSAGVTAERSEVCAVIVPVFPARRLRPARAQALGAACPVHVSLPERTAGPVDSLTETRALGALSRGPCPSLWHLPVWEGFWRAWC